jgi:hypothetical protein
MEQKFKDGQFVFAVVNPTSRLKIRRYIPTIYYCTVMDDPDGKELVYFERELMAELEDPSVE